MRLWLGLHPTKRCDLDKSFNQSTQNYPPITISNLKTQTLELAIVKDVTKNSIVAPPSIRNRPLVPGSELVCEGHRFYFFTSTRFFFNYIFFSITIRKPQLCIRKQGQQQTWLFKIIESYKSFIQPQMLQLYFNAFNPRLAPSLGCHEIIDIKTQEQLRS